MYTLNDFEKAEKYKFNQIHPRNCKLIKINKFKKFILKLLGYPIKSPAYRTHLEFYTTGIGTGIYCVCDYCGERKDITDYKSW